MQQRHTNRERVASWVVCGLASLAILRLYYPGFLSNDPLVQLKEARHWVFDGWHPPVMAALWHYVDLVIPGQGGMLVLQVVGFNVALMWVLRCLVPAKTALVSFALILLSPTVLAIVGTVWKDVHFCVAMLLACGAAGWSVAATSHARRWRWLALMGLFLSYAAAVRHNGATAVVPVAFWALFKASQVFSPQLSRWRTVALAGALSLVPVGAANIATTLLVNVPAARLAQYTAMFDLVGMSLRLNENLLPPMLQTGPKAQPMEVLRENFHPQSCVELFFVGEHRLGPMQTDDEQRELILHWLGTIAQHPMVYLKHRAQVTRLLLGTGSQPTTYVFHHGVDPNGDGCVAPPASRTEAVLGWHDRVKDSVFFRPWAFLIPAAVVLVLAFRRRTFDSLATVIAVSSVGYLLPFLVLAQATDFRYLWWCSVAGCVLIVSLIHDAVVAVTAKRATGT